jgi:predicted DNA-binding transcriptional regulator AlpA
MPSTARREYKRMVEPKVEQLWTKRELRHRLSNPSPSTLDRIIEQPGFPAGMRISDRRIVWRPAEIEAWLETRRVPAADAVAE